MENNSDWIVRQLPYKTPFLFVDQLGTANAQGIEGWYTFNSNAEFYKGHFIDNPVTPGVLLTECCAQIGLVCLGIFLLGKDVNFKKLQMGMSSSQMEFLAPVYPGEKVRVVSTLEYFRFQKLKCKVNMYNQQNKLVCKGVVTGMMGIANE